MERAHHARLQRRFRTHLKRACGHLPLDIADDYAFMQPELVGLLERRMQSFL